jgi:lipid-binding SYLF domain-containing protein
MRRMIVISAFLLTFAGMLRVEGVKAAETGYKRWEELVRRSGRVLSEVQKMPDDAIPEDLLRKCSAVAVFPDTVSAGLGIGGKYGQGVIMARDRKGKWSPPAVFSLAGLSMGMQIGGQATDIVLLIMGRNSVEAILDGKFKLGVDAAVAAGPVGRDAQAATDASLGGILSYSRTRGLFIGVKLEGDIISEHWDGNERLYGREVSAEEILLKKKVRMPDAADAMMKVLKRYPRKD